MIKLLICESNEEWSKKLIKSLDSDQIHIIDTTTKGREAQAALTKNEVDILLINLEVTTHSCLEVIKFIKYSSTRTQIILLANSKEIIEDYFYNPKEIKHLGISEVLIKPFPIQNVQKSILGISQSQSWQTMEAFDEKERPVANIEMEVSGPDSTFTSLEIDNFNCVNTSIFDIYLRLHKNRYLKIANAGEVLEKERLYRYREEKKVKRLYFKTKDRISYIQFINELIARSLKKKKEITIEQVHTIEAASELYIEEIYSSGLPEHIVNEGLAISENIYHIIQSNKDLKNLLDNFISENESEESHIFLTAFFTAIITSNLSWVTEHSRSKILMGAFLHDIGKIKLPKTIRGMKKEELTQEQLKEYKMHPEYGVQLLESIPLINEQVLQIVYQHHELNTGDGFPSSLASRRIYPPAKIVGFSDFMAHFCVTNKLSPFEAIKKAISEQKEIMKYEPDAIKAFIRGFVNNV